MRAVFVCGRFRVFTRREYPLNVAQLLARLDRADEAVVHFRRSVELKKKSLGENAAEISEDYGRIGSVLAEAGDNEGAEKSFKQSIEQARKNPAGECSFDAVRAYAVFRTQQGDPESAFRAIDDELEVL